ncbi:MAG: hypothetical protein FVQ83_16375 [Chloroflexi bacterium]|nr:hypothetical protein [Chloroflexota bacterium]
MKGARNLLSGVLLLIGVVWFLQGVGVLPGSFMTGDIRWAVAGIVSAAVGIGLWRYNRDREN